MNGEIHIHADETAYTDIKLARKAMTDSYKSWKKEFLETSDEISVDEKTKDSYCLQPNPFTTNGSCSAKILTAYLNEKA